MGSASTIRSRYVGYKTFDQMAGELKA